MENLKGRVVIITGGSRGIGKNIALRLVQEEVKIVVAAKTKRVNPRLPGNIFQTVDEIQKAGGEAMAVACNVRHHQDIENLVDQTMQSYGRIDVLINNAGAIWLQPIEKTPERRMDLVHEVNYKAPYLLSQAVLPHMRKNGWGHIINMSPPIEPEVMGRRIAYLISKFSMSMLTKGLAEELKGEPVAINSLWPKTLIESLATINWSFGEKKDWRKPDIIADATLWILRQPPLLFKGGLWLDEDILRKFAKITDFSSYNCVADAEPMKLDWELLSKKLGV